ncbi:MAG: SPFH domain-containing protein [Planctomycetota bacterium]
MSPHQHHDHGDDGHVHELTEGGIGGEPLGGGAESFDAANQSLADALRSSFRVLKGIMLVLVVLYLFSNVRTLGGHEQAVVLRLGRLLPKVHEAGLVWALPFPVDQIVPLPTRKSNDITIESHTLFRRENEEGKPFSFLSRGEHEGLDASLDGALITSDSGLIHVQWKISYKIDALLSYLATVSGQGVESAENLIRTLVETAGIQVASEHSAEEMIRTQVDKVQGEMKWRINERLRELGSGVVVTMVEVFEPTPPVQVRNSFDDTQKAENAKQQRIRGAERERIRILNEAAGAAHVRLVKLLDQIDGQVPAEKSKEELQKDLESLLTQGVEGKAGKLIKDASSYHSVVVGEIQSDVKLYRALLPEYRRNASLLEARLREQTRHQIFNSPGVTKVFRPSALREFRIRIPLDPEQTRMEEEDRLRKKDVDVTKLRPEVYHPVGPEYD